MKDIKYTPIDCNLYDELEILAMRQQKAEIVYQVDGEEKVLQGALIKNVYSREKIEYLKLESGEEIRLDTLLKVDGKVFKGHC